MDFRKPAMGCSELPIDFGGAPIGYEETPRDYGSRIGCVETRQSHSERVRINPNASKVILTPVKANPRDAETSP